MSTDVTSYSHRLNPPSPRGAALAAVLTVAGGLVWPIGLRGDFDAGEYAAIFVATGVVLVVGVVALVLASTRTAATAILAGGLPVAATMAWWLHGADAGLEWPVVVSSALFVVGSLVAAFSRRDPVVWTGYRTVALGAAVAGVLLWVGSYLVEPAPSMALIAALTMGLPLLVGCNALAGRRLGLALATAALLLGLGSIQVVGADSFADPALWLTSIAAISMAIGAGVAIANPTIAYRQRVPAWPGVIALILGVLLSGAGLTAAWAAESNGEGDSQAVSTPTPTPTPSETAEPSETPTPTASPSTTPSPTAAPTTSPATSATPTPTPTPTPSPTTSPSGASADTYKGSPAIPVAGAGLDADCQTTAARVICVDKGERKLYFIVDGQIVQRLDARFGGVAHPTREGAFSIYRKDRDHTSTLYGSNMPFAMFFSRGEAVHFSIDFATRGYNGHSHGCVNIRDREGIAWLFDRVPVDTPIYIYD